MDMASRNQYLQGLRKEYLKEDSRRNKSKLLDEAVKRTELCRKYLIVKLGTEARLKVYPRKARSCHYGPEVITALAKIWRIFDYPCGLRLAVLLKNEVDRLRKLRELNCTDVVANCLKTISPATIDIKLKHEREAINLRRNRNHKVHPLLYQKIPVKLTDEWDTDKPGSCQLDYVMHCGRSVAGNFIHSLSLVDICSGWWEGTAIITRSQEHTHNALKGIAARLPFKIIEIHPDNDSGIINDLIYRWTKANGIAFSRSRPNKKNDNAFVEQKNWTHVRKIFGYWRYDSKDELVIMNSLYFHYLRLYKNFFQPRIKLIDKERIGGHIKRRYDTPKTPYQRLIESTYIDNETKYKLKRLYDNLNPAQLQREIRKRLLTLHKINGSKIQPEITIKKVSPSVRKYISQPREENLLSVR